MSKPALCLPSLYAASLVSTPSLISTLACSAEVSPDALSDRTGIFLSRVQISSPHSNTARLLVCLQSRNTGSGQGEHEYKKKAAQSEAKAISRNFYTHTLEFHFESQLSLDPQPLDFRL